MNKDSFGQLLLKRWQAVNPGLKAKDMSPMIDAFFSTVKEAVVTDGEVKLPPMCNFRVATSAARAGRNPQTGEPMQIKASKRVAFKPTSGMKL